MPSAVTCTQQALVLNLKKKITSLFGCSSTLSQNFGVQFSPYQTFLLKFIKIYFYLIPKWETQTATNAIG